MQDLDARASHLRGLFRAPCGVWVRPHRLRVGGVIAVPLRPSRAGVRGDQYSQGCAA